MNAKKAREAFGDAYEKEMRIPLCIEDYNQHMGGVDIADQLRSYHSTQLSSFRAWWPMFFWAYDPMISNAFGGMPRGPDIITHKGFRLHCAWSLILAGAEQISTSQDSQSTSQNPSCRMPERTLHTPGPNPRPWAPSNSA